MSAKREEDLRFKQLQAMEPEVADVSVCGCETGALHATYHNGSSLPAGFSFQWYSLANGAYVPVPATITSSTASTLVVPAPTVPASTTAESLPSTSVRYVSIVYTSGQKSVAGPRRAARITYDPPPVVSVTAQKLCKGKPPMTISLSVNNPSSSTTDYYWFDTDTQITSPYPVGPTLSVTLSAPRAYYVQAIPKIGATGCVSMHTRVEVIYNQTILPTQTLVPVAVVKGSPLQVSLDSTPGYTYTWDWGEQPAVPATVMTSNSTALATSHTYQTVGGYDVKLTVKDTNSPTACEYTLPYHVEVGSDLCDAQLPAANLATVKVRRSNRNGSFLFIPDTNCPSPNSAFACLTGQADLSGAENLAVASSAVSLTDLPPAASVAYNLSDADLAANPFLAGAGRLRPEATYSYATPVSNNAYSTERGRFQVMPFNWQVNSSFHLPAWRQAGLATRYSPDGQALEEQDILHIYSAVKFGYQGHSLPYLTAKNARYGQVLFDSFEYPNALQGDDAFPNLAYDAQVDTAQSHSGHQSLRMIARENGQSYSLSLPRMNISGEIRVQFWLRLSDRNKPEQALDKSKQFKNGGLSLAVGYSYISTTATVVAQTGEWMLCEATLDFGPSGASFGPIPLTISGALAPSQLAWIDDVRLQPLGAQMSCYVYDTKTLKLLTSFDDQHFGLYYQYNAEGKLVRKQVETERGLMTIQETQYNLPRP
jgi:PKD repeat protein